MIKSNTSWCNPILELYQQHKNQKHDSKVDQDIYDLDILIQRGSSIGSGVSKVLLPKNMIPIPEQETIKVTSNNIPKIIYPSVLLSIDKSKCKGERIFQRILLGIKRMRGYK